MDSNKSLDTLLDERTALHQNGSSQEQPKDPSAPLPPSMAHKRETDVNDLLREINRVPLFMTSLDETDGSGGDNLELEALKAIAYEGTRAEIAQNFREQGTELIRAEKRYAEARDFYSKAITALRSPPPEPDPEQGPSVIEIDDEAEERKEREIEEVCLVNRALCNLEMKNYGQCKRDCAEALKLNPKNVKAWYRAASACLALDQTDQAIDAAESGLRYDAANTALKTVLEKSAARKTHLHNLEQRRQERETHLRAEQTALRSALRARNIPVRSTPHPPEKPESAITLSTPLDPNSTLTFPTLLLYPLHAQTDFIKAFAEDTCLADHLSYILPLPWDERGEYASMAGVECYIETAEGGLVKAGKKVGLGKLLGSGKVEVVDELVRVNVVPKARAGEWIAEFKARRGKA